MFSTKFRWFICNPFKMQFSPLHSLEHHCNYLNVILRYFTTRYYFSDRWDQYWGEQPPRQIVSDFPLLCLSSSSRVSLIYFLSLSLVWSLLWRKLPNKRTNSLTCKRKQLLITLDRIWKLSRRVNLLSKMKTKLE